MGVGVYFNLYVVVNGILIKYGVVLLKILEEDLINWDILYLVGWLYKLVKILCDDFKICFVN